MVSLIRAQISSFLEDLNRSALIHPHRINEDLTCRQYHATILLNLGERKVFKLKQ